MTLSPGQKKLLTYGVPIVAVLGIVVYLRSRSSSSAATGTTAATGSTTAIDAGQLADFENNVSGQLSDFAGQISGLAGAISLQPPVSDPTQTPTQTGTTSMATPSAPTPPAPGNTPAPSTGLAVVSSPNYLGAVNPGTGAVVDVGVVGQPGVSSTEPTPWTTTPISGGFEHVGAGGQTYYAPAGAPPNTLPPGAVLPSWASSVEQYFASA